jgi:hypothetical protein
VFRFCLGICFGAILRMQSLSTGVVEVDFLLLLLLFFFRPLSDNLPGKQSARIR